MTDPEFPDRIRDDARTAWHRYIDFFSPFRPQLYKYCRRLTGDVWDAEDLVQDTMVRGFGVLGQVHKTINNPRAYLMRIATNLWTDALRHRTSGAETLATLRDQPHGAIDAKPDPREVRDAGTRLMEILAPQERAALVLKEVFDMSLDEIAQLLGTSVGAIKAALHRGRSRLHESRAALPSRQPVPSAALVDGFVEHLNGSDLNGLLALMLDTATIEMPGNLVEVGRKEFERAGSWLWQAVHVHPDLPAEMRPPKFVNERAIYKGEPIMLAFLVDGGFRLLMAVVRFEELDGQIARIRAYDFSPEVIQEVAADLGLAAGLVPYRFPTLEPGQYVSDVR
jgi:RNA polymerase sigma-70 factor (ECF subfamily)